MKATAALLALLVSCPLVPSVAAEHDHHPFSEEEEHLHGDPHVHGSAMLQVVFEGDLLEIRLLSPAINLLGFEGAAANQEQRQTGRAVREVLGQPDELFVVEGTRCEAQRGHTLISGLGDDAGSHNDHHADNDHDDHHADDDHDHHGADEEHGDIEAQYRFSCQMPERAASMRLPILSRFPGIETVDVQWIARGKQGAVTLEADNQTVVFR